MFDMSMMFNILTSILNTNFGIQEIETMQYLGLHFINMQLTRYFLLLILFNNIREKYHLVLYFHHAQYLAASLTIQ